MTCSEKEDSLPVDMAYDPSMEPVVEKAQHEPHCAWFFTGVTAPLATCTVEGAGGAVCVGREENTAGV